MDEERLSNAARVAENILDAARQGTPLLARKETARRCRCHKNNIEGPESDGRYTDVDQDLN